VTPSDDGVMLHYDQDAGAYVLERGAPAPDRPRPELPDAAGPYPKIASAIRELEEIGKRLRTERAAAGRGDYHEIPPLAIAAVARRLEHGRAKHGGGRAYLRAGEPLSVWADKVIRHTFRALAGDAAEDHLAAAAVDLLVLLELRERIRRGELPPALDDLDLAGPE